MEKLQFIRRLVLVNLLLLLLIIISSCGGKQKPAPTDALLLRCLVAHRGTDGQIRGCHPAICSSEASFAQIEPRASARSGLVTQVSALVLSDAQATERGASLCAAAGRAETWIPGLQQQ